MIFHSEPKLICTKKILNHKRNISFMEKDKLKNFSQRRQSTISTTIAYAAIR